ncbi:MAG: LysM peptidoglycan-binding domain-containing protein [Chloroflexi bacterium]|nr:LysM peptidoglycan-binding domain-containing protein [Chloroflexota bacterium]
MSSLIRASTVRSRQTCWGGRCPEGARSMANSVGSSGGLLAGTKTVTTAGTRVAIEDGTVDLVRSLAVIALSTNTGRIFLGGADVDSSTNVGMQAGDTLSGIAQKLALGGWQALYDANRATIGGNPNVIKPGQVLVVP